MPDHRSDSDYRSGKTPHITEEEMCPVLSRTETDQCWLGFCRDFIRPSK